MKELTHVLTQSLKIINGSYEQHAFFEEYKIPAFTEKDKKQTLKFYIEIASQLVESM